MIGSWIGFKSVAQWSAWNKNRYVFNRFLLAHAAIVIISWFMMDLLEEFSFADILDNPSEKSSLFLTYPIIM
jgi:hypothetical protein